MKNLSNCSHFHNITEIGTHWLFLVVRNETYELAQSATRIVQQ